MKASRLASGLLLVKLKSSASRCHASGWAAAFRSVHNAKGRRRSVGLLRRELESADYAVLEAGDGHQALPLARTEQPDLIVLDILMPGLNGFEQLHRYALLIDDDSPVEWLQSVEQPQLAFALLEPFVFYPDYGFELADRDWHLGWDAWITGSLAIETVSGTHAGLVENSNSAELADVINRVLAELTTNDRPQCRVGSARRDG